MSLRSFQSASRQIDVWFREGARAAEFDATMMPDDCPHDRGSEADLWWRRGFSYSARLLRAMDAELKLKALKEAACRESD